MTTITEVFEEATALRAGITEGDRHILTLLCEAWRRVANRRAQFEQLADLHAKLRSMAGASLDVVAPGVPWGDSLMASPREESHRWLRRFSDMALRCDLPQGDNPDLLLWFSRRRY